MTIGRGWIAAFAFAVTTWGSAGPAFAEEVATDVPEFMKTPEWLGQKYVGEGEWTALDTLVEKLADSGERSVDGRFQLYLLTAGINKWLGLWSEENDEQFSAKFAEYDQQFPRSAFPPILAVMQVHASAWRARGRGYSSSVTREGWALFRERNAKAWKMIQASKGRSARLPIWYEEAITIGADADIPYAELMALFEEGIARFPGYHPLYFSIARQFSPRWGGNYADADTFIRAQVAAKTNKDGEMLYARLYWLIDQYSGGDPDFFEESQVDWSRMRAGFELLMQEYPESARNRANFAAFACRAGDGPTYMKLRARVDGGEFMDGAPEGISLEVCDARFILKT